MPAPILAARAQGGTSACSTGAALSFVSFIPLFDDWRSPWSLVAVAVATDLSFGAQLRRDQEYRIIEGDTFGVDVGDVRRWDGRPLAGLCKSPCRGVACYVVATVPTWHYALVAAGAWSVVRTARPMCRGCLCWLVEHRG